MQCRLNCCFSFLVEVAPEVWQEERRHDPVADVEEEILLVSFGHFKGKGPQLLLAAWDSGLSVSGRVTTHTTATPSIFKMGRIMSLSQIFRVRTGGPRYLFGVVLPHIVLLISSVVHSRGQSAQHQL